jgi:hypothetical protein
MYKEEQELAKIIVSLQGMIRKLQPEFACPYMTSSEIRESLKVLIPNLQENLDKARSLMFDLREDVVPYRITEITQVWLRELQGDYVFYVYLDAPGEPRVLIQGTENLQFKTREGYKSLKDLKVGDEILRHS